MTASEVAIPAARSTNQANDVVLLPGQRNSPKADARPGSVWPCRTPKVGLISPGLSSRCRRDTPGTSEIPRSGGTKTSGTWVLGRAGSCARAVRCCCYVPTICTTGNCFGEIAGSGLGGLGNPDTCECPTCSCQADTFPHLLPARGGS